MIKKYFHKLIEHSFGRGIDIVKNPTEQIDCFQLIMFIAIQMKLEKVFEKIRSLEHELPFNAFVSQASLLILSQRKRYIL